MTSSNSDDGAAYLPSKLLIVDDEPQIRKFLRVSFAADDCEVIEAANGTDGLGLAAKAEPDCVILDLRLPDLDGLEVLRQIREWSNVPVIVLSIEDGESTVVDALDQGADDYVTKPFRVAVLLARIRAVFRRRTLEQNGTSGDQPRVSVGPLTIDRARHSCHLNGSRLDLTPKEFALLELLARHAGRVLTHRYLLENIWGPAHAEDIEYVRVFIKQLRQKLEADPASPVQIVTETGIGYRLGDEV